ncbi:MAG: type II secretion system F family protein [Candidatus Omnitrophica bacterium]|nr:type II secretion system F family protein [Candidatus Omnitrophota bacterium]
MPTFIYKAKEPSGKTRTGSVVAKDKQEAMVNLRQQNMIVLAISQGELKQPLWKVKSKKIDEEQIALFFRQLATLVGAGIPLTKGLTILSGQFKGGELRKITESIRNFIESGSSLSDALANYPHVFALLYVHMVNAGESSGALNEILERLASYIEKNNDLVKRVKSAMVYPAAIVMVALLITSFLIFKVIPGFKEIFSSLGAKLPVPTQLLIDFSDTTRKYIFPIIIGIGLAFSGIIKYINSAKGRVKFDELKLKLPIFGALLQKLIIARFCQTLRTLLKSGIPILNALDIVSNTVDNNIVQAAILRVRDQVSKGERIALQLGKESIFPQMVVEMISVGEESGELELMLNKIGGFYEEQVAVAVNNMMSLIEPFIIIFLGAVVGGIVVAMFLPILKITELVGG